MNTRTAGTPSSARAALTAIAILAALAALGPLAAGAIAAPLPPTVSTGGAQGVSFGSATLTGSVNPRGSDTSYYFQYGATKGYGGQTVIANAGAGMKSVKVSAAIAGLQPITRYHFRLVAVNASGQSAAGADASLLTTKVPLSLQILAAPNPVLFGGTISVQGTLSGTENAGRPVVLQSNAFPFTAGFANVALNTQLTTSTGSFNFTVPGLTQATQFRVITSTNPAVVSPVATESVAVRVIAHVSRAHRRHHARIYGIVSPALNGAQVGIMRVSHGRNVLIGGTVLRHRNATSSSFSRVVPVHRGIYRVLVRITNGAQSSNYSGPLQIR